MLSPGGARGVQKAELNGNVDSENNHGGSSRDIMYYIGLDVHKKTISYCVKDAVRSTGKARSEQHDANSTAG
jgi:hypothetical protein